MPYWILQSIMNSLRFGGLGSAQLLPQADLRLRLDNTYYLHFLQSWMCFAAVCVYMLFIAHFFSIFHYIYITTYMGCILYITQTSYTLAYIIIWVIYLLLLTKLLDFILIWANFVTSNLTSKTLVLYSLWCCGVGERSHTIIGPWE